MSRPSRRPMPAPPPIRPILEGFFRLSPENNSYRKPPPQLGGAFGFRLFGGQTVAHSYVVAQEFLKDHRPTRLDVTFVAPGRVDKDVEYKLVTHDSVDSTRLIYVTTAQDGNVLATSLLRLSPTDKLVDSPAKLRHAIFPVDVKEPLAYQPIQTYLVNLPPKEFLRQIGRDYRYTTKDELYLFDWRPVNIQHYGGITHEHEPLQVWARLADTVRDLPIPHPMVVPLMISDYISGHPLVVLHDQRRIKYLTSASLTHKCVFHCYDFDPHGFFYLNFDFDTAAGVALMRGRIFDERRRLVLTFLQNHHFVTENDRPPKKPKL